MDSGSTTLIVLFVLAVAAFAALRAADAAIPLLRRTAVREHLEAKSFKSAAVNRLRTSRVAYEETVRLTSTLAMGALSGTSLAILLRETNLNLALVLLIVVGVALAAIGLGAVGESLVAKCAPSRLVGYVAGVQIALWPALQVRTFARIGPRNGSARSEATGNGDGHHDHEELEVHIEDELGDEPLERHERDMIQAILHLDQTPVREIMVPRVDMVSLDVASPIDGAIARMLESGHSRLPVWEENPDNVIGILYSRDLLAATARGKGAAAPVVRDLLRPCFFVPESKRIDEMLAEFQQRRVHMAVIVDEYGGVVGIVTIEDLLEEIVGEIEDEFDREEPHIERTSSGDAVVDARISIDSFNEEFKKDINPQGFDTLGGLLYSRLGRIPTAGDVIDESGLRLQVIATAGRRIRKVKVSPVEPPPPSVDGSAPDHAAQPTNSL